MYPPIAEIFCSPQGEGTHTGRLMIFLRLAGCTVGRNYIPALSNEIFTDSNIPILHPYQHQCTLYDNRKFPCDTDYDQKETISGIDDLKYRLRGVHKTCGTICLTGGEPLMHGTKFLHLVNDLHALGYRIHVETSATIPINDDITLAVGMIEHVAISPKKGFLFEYLNYWWVKDVKLLIDERFFPSALPPGLEAAYYGRHVRQADMNIFLQPVNECDSINVRNLQLCLDLQQKLPHLKLSTQVHKAWGVR